VPAPEPQTGVASMRPIAGRSRPVGWPTSLAVAWVGLSSSLGLRARPA